MDLALQNNNTLSPTTSMVLISTSMNADTRELASNAVVAAMPYTNTTQTYANLSTESYVSQHEENVQNFQYSDYPNDEAFYANFSTEELLKMKEGMSYTYSAFNNLGVEVWSFKTSPKVELDRKI